MKTILAALLLLVMVQLVLADEASRQFEEANQSYRGGNLEQAAALYEQIVAGGYESPGLFYNLGNAYYKLKRYPEAILNYERARRLAPNDEDIDYNLRLANLHVVDKIEPVPTLFFIDWWQRLLNLFSTDGWAWLAVALLWAAVVCAGAFLMTRSFLLRRIFSIGAVAVLALSLVSYAGMWQRMQADEQNQFAVIFTPSVSVKSAPDAQSTDLFVLHEGVKLEILDSVGEWRKIRLADGKVGWMEIGEMKVI